MKKISIIMAALLLILANGAFAFQPAIIGGVRDGLAIGFMADGPLAKNVGIRVGVEGDTGKQPLIFFLGGKFYLGSVGRSQMSLGLGMVAYSGNSTDIGGAFSLIFNRAFGVAPLFFEAGVDIASTARIQAQLGYKLF
ncbi:MAG TPA: hypothetical protein VMD02_07510 [Candidatus Omnitrophota bacterium]|nr:hypothetical protein [Candidatus Omnitrophota bacterium]